MQGDRAGEPRLEVDVVRRRVVRGGRGERLPQRAVPRGGLAEAGQRGVGGRVHHEVRGLSGGRCGEREGAGGDSGGNRSTPRPQGLSPLLGRDPTPTIPSERPLRHISHLSSESDAPPPSGLATATLHTAIGGKSRGGNGLGCGRLAITLIERPVFIVAPPRSGGGALLNGLRPGARRIHRAERPGVLEPVFELNPANRDWDSNRLTAADVEPRASSRSCAEPQGGHSSIATETGRASTRPGSAGWMRPPRNALRVPFLAAIAPTRVRLRPSRAPRDASRCCRPGDRDGAVTYPELPGWPGPPWSLPLVPGLARAAGP